MKIKTTIILTEDEKRALDKAIDYFWFKQSNCGKQTVAYGVYETDINALGGILNAEDKDDR